MYFPRLLLKGIEKICFALLVIMTFVLFIQTVNRYLLNGSFLWAEECALVSMVWIAFFGSIVAVGRNAHTRIDFLILKLPPKAKKIIDIIDNLIVAVFLVVVGRFSLPIIALTKGTQMPGMKISRAILFYSVLVGCAFMVLYLLVLSYCRFRDIDLLKEGE